eukprot:3932009-Rhodomonas_salina.6
MYPSGREWPSNQRVPTRASSSQPELRAGVPWRSLLSTHARRLNNSDDRIVQHVASIDVETLGTGSTNQISISSRIAVARHLSIAIFGNAI